MIMAKMPTKLDDPTLASIALNKITGLAMGSKASTVLKVDVAYFRRVALVPTSATP